MAKPSLEYTQYLRIVGAEPEAAPGVRPGQNGIHGKALLEGNGTQIGIIDILPKAQEILYGQQQIKILSELSSLLIKIYT